MNSKLSPFAGHDGVGNKEVTEGMLKRAFAWIAVSCWMAGCASGRGYDQRLLDAVSVGDRQTAIKLIDKGEGINETYEVSGDSPLDLAAARGDLGLVKLLLEHRADPHHKNDSDKTADQLSSDTRIKDMIRKAQGAH